MCCQQWLKYCGIHNPQRLYRNQSNEISGPLCHQYSSSNEACQQIAQTGCKLSSYTGRFQIGEEISQRTVTNLPASSIERIYSRAAEILSVQILTVVENNFTGES